MNAVANAQPHAVIHLDGADNIASTNRREQGLNATVFRGSSSGSAIITNADTKDTVNVHYNADGSGTVTVNGEKFEFTAEEMLKLNVYTGDGDDTVTVTGHTEGRGGLSIFAGAGNDNVTGGNGDESVYGGDGNDIIDTNGGNDTVFGGAGRDTINGGSGNDTIHGGDGKDRLLGGSGNDSLYGNDGRDKLYGGEGTDQLSGGRGKDGKSQDGDGGVSATQEADTEQRINLFAAAVEARAEEQEARQEEEVTGGARSGGRGAAAGGAEGGAGGAGAAEGGGGAGGAEGGGGAEGAEGAAASDKPLSAEESAAAEGAEGAEGAEAAEGGEGGGGGAEDSGDIFGGGGSWMLQLAMAQAKIQDFFLKEALDANAEMAALTESGAASQDEGKGTDLGRAQFLRAQATYSASIQMFNNMSTQAATSIKTVGEAIAAISRKQ